MADDLFNGVLGGGDEQPETEAPQALAGAEAFAAAVAAIASRQDPGVARRTEAFLAEQTRLLETQRHHLEEEHASRLTQLRLAVTAAKRKRYADHVRNCLYTAIAVLVLGVLAAATRMTFEAMSDHGLVVEDFTVPSDFAARGITSQALAQDLASRVASIRATANGHSFAYSGEVRADQAAVLKVQIPETGLSVDELERFLHHWLGHQTVVNGELREGAGEQVSLVLHIAGADPVVVSGASADLDRLMQTAAEQAFAIFDPINHVIYLEAMGRPAEAYAASQRYVHSARVGALSSQGQVGAYSLLAHADPDTRRALSEALLSIDGDPRGLVHWTQAVDNSARLGHDEAVVDLARKEIEIRRQDQPASQRDAYAWIIAEGRSYIDRATGDFPALGRDFAVYDQRAEAHPVSDSYAERAQVAALLHDEAAAREDLTQALAAGPADAAALEARWDISTAAGDWTQALDVARARVAEEEAQKSKAPSPEFAARPELALETQYDPLLAYAEAMTGDGASATAAISQTPTDCYLCVRTRAKVAAAAGDAATADRWFAQAVRQAPDLPMAYYEWGEALLARGDLAGAARELSLAHDKGPRFADPLKGWGDVLVKQGHPKDALAKYGEALKYAPSWVALKQARDTAAGKSS